MAVNAKDVYLKETARRAVRITLGDGEVLEGSLIVPKTRGISEVLNGLHAFIDFETWKGEQMHIAKTALRTVQPLGTQRRNVAA